MACVLREGRHGHGRTARREGLPRRASWAEVVSGTGQQLIRPGKTSASIIWGPRTVRRPPRVMPAILDAPGAVVSTSNKRDVVDGTRGVREATAPVWVFDPQKIARRNPHWWWNPLSYVTDEEKAYKLTQHFAVGSRVPGIQAGRLLRSQSRRHPLLVLPRGRTRAGCPSPRSTSG